MKSEMPSYYMIFVNTYYTSVYYFRFILMRIECFVRFLGFIVDPILQEFKEICSELKVKSLHLSLIVIIIYLAFFQTM